jgi:hypothetical protein
MTPTPTPSGPDRSEAERWRTGRKVGRTVYVNDELVGVMDTPELAEQVVRAVTELDELRAENADLRRLAADELSRLGQDMERGEPIPTHPASEACVHCATPTRLASSDPVIDCPRGECPNL